VALVLAADATLDPVTALIVNGGIIGLFFALALLGQIALKPELNRRDDQEKRQQALIDTLLAVYHHEVLPTLSDYEKRLSPLLSRVERKLDELEWFLGQEEGGRNEAARHPRGRGPQDRSRGGVGQGPGTGDYPPAPSRS
jgi:hypothetical protein